jgi:hypothetical protein
MGDRVSGAYCDGLRCGKFEIFVRQDVRIAAFPYLDGEIDGPLDLWYQPQNAPYYPSKHKARFEYYRGRRSGVSRYWCSNGHPRAEVFFSDGQIDSASAWRCEKKLEPVSDAMLVARDLLAKDETYFDVLISFLDEAAPSCDPVGPV